MNVRIFWVRAIKCMCAQTRPRFILSSEGVFGGIEFEPMLTPREKPPLPENVPRGGSNPRRCGQQAQALPTELFRPPSLLCWLKESVTVFGMRWLIMFELRWLVIISRMRGPVTVLIWQVNIEGFRPEWCILTIYHGRDIPFWWETLDMFGMKWFVVFGMRGSVIIVWVLMTCYYVRTAKTLCCCWDEKTCHYVLNEISCYYLYNEMILYYIEVQMMCLCFRYWDEEMTYLLQMLTSQPPLSHAGTRFVTLAVCVIISCPSLLGWAVLLLCLWTASLA